MAAIYNCAGLFVDIEGVNANVTLRHTLIEMHTARETMNALTAIRAATVQNFVDVVKVINGGDKPDDFDKRPNPEYELFCQYSENGVDLRGIEGADPVCTIWGKVNGITITVTSADAPIHALVCYYAIRDLAKPQTTPTQPPARQSAPPASAPEPERSESGTEHLGKFDTRQDYSDYDNCIVSFEVAQIAREFSRKGDVCWKFYPEINGKAGQYPIHGMTTYSDNDKVPEPVREFLDKIEGEVFGPWRVVVYVAAKEDGKVNYYIKKIERVQVQHPF